MLLGNTLLKSINSFPTVDDTRSICGQCESRSDCTEHTV